MNNLWLLFVFGLAAIVTASQPTYKASVIEYSPVFSHKNETLSPSEAADIIATNLASISNLVREAAKSGSDIVVIPEDALYGFLNCRRDQIYPYLEHVPTAESGANPCTDEKGNSSLALHAFSCLARDNGLVLVGDLGEVYECTSEDPYCPPDGRYQFNTQVAFDVDGTLIARYRKYHLFHEPQYNVPYQVPQYFTTRFGVTFGLMVCFDIMFLNPSEELAEELAIKNIILSSWWVNTPPSMTATQWYQSWSQFHNVTLLVAGGVMPDAWAFSGSGIFHQGDTLAQFYNVDTHPKNVLLTADVPFTASPPPSATVAHGHRGAQHTRVPGLLGAEPLHCADPDTAIAPRTRELGAEWGWSPFLATPGSIHNLTAVSGSLTCTATVEVSSTRLAAKSEAFALLAYEGTFESQYSEMFCAVCRCVSMKDCATFSTTSSTPFASLTLDAVGLPPTMSVFSMAAANDGLLLARDETAMSSAAGARLETTDAFDVARPLSNFALLAIALN